MSETNEFVKYCAQVLEVNFGQISGEIINKVKSNKNFNDQLNINDFKEFIDLIEPNIIVLSGKNKATDICNVLMTKAVEIMEKHKEPEISISDIDKEIIKAEKEISSREKINEEIDNFLTRYRQPTQMDVDDFINYIRLLKLSFQEKELREQIEKERLFRKFHTSSRDAGTPRYNT